MITLTLDDSQILYVQWQQEVAQKQQEISAPGVTMPEYSGFYSRRNNWSEFE